MKKVALLLTICLLLILSSVSASAIFINKYEWDDEWVAGVDYVDGELLLMTESILELSQYNTGTPVDFYGVKVLSISYIFSIPEEEALNKHGFLSYHIILDPSESTKEAFETLNTNKYIYAEPNFIFYSEPEPEPEPIPGDVNGDGELNMFDYAYVKNVYFNLETATDIEKLKADVNFDGSVNVFDYIQVKTAYFAK